MNIANGTKEEARAEYRRVRATGGDETEGKRAIFIALRGCSAEERARIAQEIVDEESPMGGQITIHQKG